MNVSKVKHPRLYAFYESKVLNAMGIITIVSLLCIKAFDTLLLPVLCASVAAVAAIGYSAWLWIAKPDKIVINSWLSDMSGSLTLYSLIVSAMDTDNKWWFYFPILCSVAILFVSLVRNQDRIYDITNQSITTTIAE